jgi:chromosome partitioning protein
LKVVSIINYKGGVGKTTLTANIATELASRGKRVLMIDLDPQASLTFSFLHVDEWERKYKDTKTIKNWFDDILNNRTKSLANYIVEDLEVNKYEQVKVSAKIGLIPSHLGLFDIELELANSIGGRGKRRTLKNKLQSLFLITDGLENLKEVYDLVLIDCQPSFSLITQGAIVASDYYMIPTKLDYLSTLGVCTLDKHISTLIDQLKIGIKEFSFKEYQVKARPLGVVSTMVETRNNELISTNMQYYKELQSNNIVVFENKIKQGSTFFNVNNCIPVVFKKANSPGEKEIIDEFKGITNEFLRRLYMI